MKKKKSSQHTWIGWLEIAIFIGLVVVMALVDRALVKKQASRQPCAGLELDLDECQTKLKDTESFLELREAAADSEVVYWKEIRKKEGAALHDVMEDMEERATGVGCWDTLDKFKKAYYWERAQRKACERKVQGE